MNLDIIKKWEGWRDTAYLCPAGKLTIGYGHTSAAGEPKVKAGMKITKEEGENILTADMRKFQTVVRSAVKVPTTENQHAAMASLCMNIGEGGFRGSSVVREINKLNYDGCPAKFALWNKITVDGKKVVSRGLVNRRADEANLFMAPESDDVVDITPPVGTKAEMTPGKSVVKSTTVQAAVLSNAPTVIAAMNGLDWRIAVPLILVTAVLTGWIIWERIRKSRQDGE